MKVKIEIMTAEGQPDVRVRAFESLDKNEEKLWAKHGFKPAWAAAQSLLTKEGNLDGVVSMAGGDSQEAWRRGVAKIFGDVVRHGVGNMLIDVKGEKDELGVAQAAAESLLLSGYKYDELESDRDKEQVVKVSLRVSPRNVSTVRKVVRETQNVMNGVHLTRDLVNRPANLVSPKMLVDEAKKLAKASNISLKTMNRAAAKRAGFTAFLEVAKGSQEEPYVIHLKCKPKQKAKMRVALVGKGITFDSGGLSLKPPEFMEDMKIDMAGAATVLGVFKALQKINLPIEVHGIVATCENMPSGTAYRPGDVIKAKNGKTIEVLNTDAEGRVTLADALVYAEEQKPDAIVDLATLTGACIVALGETQAGVWSNDDELQNELMAGAEMSGEGIVEMPMPYEYRQQIKSDVADLRNTGKSRFGGAITAAMFLREFVKETPWAHMDIAGPAYANSAILPYWQKGATGYGVRMLVNYLKAL